MRNIGFIAASLLLLAPASHAKTLEELLVEKGVITKAEASASTGNSASKVYWNKGTHIDSADSGVTSTVKVGVQPRYTFTDNDRDGSSEPNASSFDVNLARVKLSGSGMDGEWEYELEGDWAKGGADNANTTKLSNAYVQWNNCDWSSIRLGQFKTGVGRQYNTTEFAQQFADRSLPAQAYNLGRQQGLAGMLDLMDGRLKLGAGIFNGGSTGEGENLPGNDTNHTGVVNASFDVIGTMDRGSEGDVNQTENLAWDIGAAYGFTEDDYAATETFAADTFKVHLVSVDTGVKVKGFSLQGEYFWQDVDSDLSGETVSDNGAYVQAGYFIMPKKWEVAVRWGLVSCDEESQYALCTGVDDYNEAAAAINYYIMGHSLKAGLNYSIINVDPNTGEDYKNNRWIFQVSSIL